MIDLSVKTKQFRIVTSNTLVSNASCAGNLPGGRYFTETGIISWLSLSVSFCQFFRPAQSVRVVGNSQTALRTALPVLLSNTEKIKQFCVSFSPTDLSDVSHIVFISPIINLFIFFV